jgi:hypothetical protein
LEIIIKGNRSGQIYSTKVVNDMDSRINIARSIGLKSIPQFDLNAIFRLDGIIGRQLMSNSKLESVEIIKSIRESVTSGWR